MTALILGILDSQAKLLTALIGSQTPAQQAIMWNRYIEVTEPLHKLLAKLEGLNSIAEDAPAAPATPKSTVIQAQ